MQAGIEGQRMQGLASLRLIRPNTSFRDFLVVELLLRREFVGGELLHLK